MQFKDKSHVLDIRQLRFHLSDNFDGSLADAFREVADYLDTATDKLPSHDKTPEDIKKTQSNPAWPQFLEVVKKGGKLFISGAGLNRYNHDKNDWDQLPTKVKFK